MTRLFVPALAELLVVLPACAPKSALCDNWNVWCGCLCGPAERGQGLDPIRVWPLSRFKLNSPPSHPHHSARRSR